MTRYVDIIEPTLFTDYMRESTPEKYIMLMESGMLAAPPEQVTKVFYAGGWDINMPEWNDLARGEGHAPNDNPANTLTPDNIDTKKMIGRRHFIGQAWRSMDMAGYVATGNPKDPMRAIADGIQNWWYYLIERRIAATLNGIAADNAANDGGDMIVDLYADSATPAAANKVSGDAIIEAEMTLGDQHTALTTIMMHSAAYKDLKKQDMIEFEKPSDAKMRIPYYQEKQVLVSDIMPVFAGTNAAKYRMALVGSGVFSFIDDVPSEPTPKGTQGVEKDRNMLSGNGGGEDILMTRRNFFIHPRGFSYSAAGQAEDSMATLAELSNAAAWDRKHKRKNVPIAFLDVNAG